VSCYVKLEAQKNTSWDSNQDVCSALYMKHTLIITLFI
jgi:hypothetical protein